MKVPLTPLEFQLRAERYHGDKVGIVDGDERITYGTFSKRANRLANALRAIDAQPRHPVCYICPNSHHLLEGYYGVVQSGAIFSPINPRLTPEQIQLILLSSDCKILIFHAEQFGTIEALRESLPSIEHYIAIEMDWSVDWVVDYEDFLEKGSTEFGADLLRLDEDAPAETFYTYGARGNFRGATLSHRALYLHALTSLAMNHVSDGDVFLNLIPLSEANGWGVPQTAFAAGATQILLRDVVISDVLKIVEKEKVTWIYTVPGLLNALVRDPGINDYDLSSLHSVIVGGAAYSQSLIALAEEKLSCRVVGVYGQVEVGPTISLAYPKTTITDTSERQRIQATAGIPAIGVTMRILDDEGNDVPRDGKTPGEIVLRSNTVMTSYYNRPHMTSQKIQDGWYLTGDLATIDSEGYVTIVGEKRRL